MMITKKKANTQKPTQPAVAEAKSNVKKTVGKKKARPAMAVEETAQGMAVPEPVPEPVPAPVPVEEIVPLSSINDLRSSKRGRPATDRTLIMETMINVLHDTNPSEVFFNRKTLNELAMGGTVPISYVLHFVSECSTSVRGLYVLPRKWRNLWPGYETSLQEALFNIINK